MTRAAFVPSVYTPAQIADRWQCSERHVRNMVASGELPSFRLGEKLLRIRVADVEAFECRIGGSPASEANTASPSMTESAADVIDLAQATKQRRPASPRLDTPNSLGPRANS